MADTTTLLLSSALLLAALLKVADGICQLPSDNHPYMSLAIECKKETGENLLCFADCFGRKLGVVDEEGYVHEDKLDEAIETLEEGDMKEAIKYTKLKCFTPGIRIDLKKPNCSGYMKSGKCARKNMKEKCPELAAVYGM